MKTKKYYAYMIPRISIQGITDIWDDCKKIVSGKSGATYKGFQTKKEAEDWLQRGTHYKITKTSQQTILPNIKRRLIKKRLSKGMYFDAGTGRGDGVEISVTDEKGKNLLEMILPKKDINRHGKHLVGGHVTNNYGELLACKYALQLAMREHVNHIFGDSKLVILYWSKGHIKNEVAGKTIELAREVATLRYEFEHQGGTIAHISGDRNPADLGFHR